MRLRLIGKTILREREGGGDREREYPSPPIFVLLNDV